MDKLQKFDYVQKIESYLEEKQVYELLEDLLTQLIVHKPNQPLEFLTEKLRSPPMRRCFIAGMPGTQEREVGAEIAKKMKWECVHVADLIKKEMERNSERASKIK